MKKLIQLVIIFCCCFIDIIAQGPVANTLAVKTKETHQIMVGFGASLAWYENELVNNPVNGEIYNYLFNDLSLDIIRFYNNYSNNQTNINFSPAIKIIVDTMYALSPTRPKIMISSWSPPAELKSNGILNGGNDATLKKTNGEYVYGEFAQFWVNSVKAYQSIGVEPDYISIQNEPTYDAPWESCRFEPTESATIAGYDKALDSVYSGFQRAGLQTKILAAEVHGIGYNLFQNYADRFNQNAIDGYAYHLYNGESDNVSDNHDPDLFIPNLSAITENYLNKPIFQTEYSRGDWFNTAWLIQNCILYGNVSAYLCWQVSSGLIEFRGNDYFIHDNYWALRQFSKFIDPGWQRVTAESTDDSLRISAFINPEGNKLTLVILNISNTVSRNADFDLRDFKVNGARAFRTTETEKGAEMNILYDSSLVLEFPPRSITTLSLSGDQVTSVADNILSPTEFTLLQNYPNPFNPSTTISYTIPKTCLVSIKIYNMLGKEISTLVNEEKPAGNYVVQFDGSKVASGIYFYRMQSGNFTEVKKLVLIK